MPVLPGNYKIGPQGDLRPITDWQPAVEGINWGDVTGLIENWQKRGSGERKLNLWGMYIVVGLVVLVAASLAWQQVIGGEAIAGFLGAAIGYLLSRASVEGGD